ncbi:MAG: hypothetical protein RMJ52_17850, partial [Gemmataceae bacterium]|nr:hypothetical protein [Gemmataceae bacterium]
FAMAMPRGSGKTTICECACIWAVLYGHREFVCLIGSDEGHAMDMLDAIKMELNGNDLLLADFPEVCYPIQCLDGIANRCAGQLYHGERTKLVYAFPTHEKLWQRYAEIRAERRRRKAQAWTC